MKLAHARPAPRHGAALQKAQNARARARILLEEADMLKETASEVIRESQERMQQAHEIVAYRVASPLSTARK